MARSERDKAIEEAARALMAAHGHATTAETHDAWVIACADARAALGAAIAVPEEAPRSPPEVRDRLVFTDLETLGLMPNSSIVEIAMAACSPDLNVLATKTAVVFQHEVEWNDVHEVVAKMHTESGLRAESLAADRRVPLNVVEGAFIAWLEAQGFKKGEAVIAGSSIGVDRVWIATQMPALHEFLSYRMVDVSALRGLVRRWVLPGYAGPKGETVHRALPDCLWSRDELALYRRALFTGREDEIGGWLGAPLKGTP